jgi:hypothetical protein
MTDPDTPPGLDLLMSSYIQRMEMTVTKWYTNIMVVDLEVRQKASTGCRMAWPAVGCRPVHTQWKWQHMSHTIG